MADSDVPLDVDPFPQATAKQRVLYPLRRALVRLLWPYLGEIDTLARRPGTLQRQLGDLAALSRSTLLLQEQVGALQEQVGALQEQVGALQEQVGALQEQVDALDASHWNQTAITRRLAELEDALGSTGETAPRREPA